MTHYVFVQENTHKLTVEMSPDERYEEKQQELEAAKLKSMVDRLTTADREEIFTQGGVQIVTVFLHTISLISHMLR